MSWGATVSSKTTDNVEETLNENFATNYPEASAEVTEQFEAVRDAAVTLLQDGAVRGESFNVSCSGHVQNADQSDSQDHLSVSISST